MLVNPFGWHARWGHKMWSEITRLKCERRGQRFASDLTDAEWSLIEPHLPARKGLGRPRKTELRAVVGAIFYRLPDLNSNGGVAAGKLLI
jgi:hypothetical protein